jgi:hypothetical protein
LYPIRATWPVHLILLDLIVLIILDEESLIIFQILNPMRPEEETALRILEKVVKN